MTLTPENEKQIRNQLIEQINNNFPENDRKEAISRIENMNTEEIENFLVENKLIKSGEEDSPKVFRMILEGKIPSFKVGENDSAIAVLEINPISEGHTIIIPKQPAINASSLTDKNFELAKEIQDKLTAIYSPKEVKIISTNSFGEEIINIFPVYTEEHLNSKRNNSDKKELEKIKEKMDKTIIKEKEEPKIEEKIEEKTKYQITEKNTWLPRRKP
jgi:diadenosine tetraphosphate (Ap4A) HIT family hydrolase